MSWQERDHPRDGEGQFTEKWASTAISRMGFGVFSSFVDPEFEDEPRPGAQELAESWADQHLTFRDRESGLSSIVDEVEHHGDGFTVRGSFLEGGANIGQWEMSLLRDEDGSPAAVVDTISIDKPWRGQGLAREWVQRFEDGARAEGVTRISMWDQSSGFWESRGYTASFQGAFKTSEKLL